MQKGVMSIVRTQIPVTEKVFKGSVERQKEVKVINSPAFCWQIQGKETNTHLDSKTSVESWGDGSGVG